MDTGTEKRERSGIIIFASIYTALILATVNYVTDSDVGTLYILSLIFWLLINKK